jgi:ribose transport system substrate-binding protein
MIAKKHIAALTGLALAVTALSPIGGTVTSAASPLSWHANVTSGTYTVGFANEALEAPFQVNVQNSMEQFTKAAGFKLVNLDNNYDDATALRNASILAEDKVNVAVEFQSDASIAPRIAQIFKSANIPAVAIDIPEPGAIFFGANHFSDGQLTGIALGEYMAKHHWDMSKVSEILLTEPAAGPIPQLRIDGEDYGIRQIVPSLPKSALFELSAGSGTIGSAQSIVAALLPRIPSGNHIVVSGINDESVLGAVRAIQLANRESSAIYGSQGADGEGLIEIRTNPQWVGDTAYFPEFYGKFITQLVQEMKAGKTIDPYQFMPRVFLDSQNVAQYYPGKVTVAVKSPPGGVEASMTAKNVLPVVPPGLP